MLYRTLVAVRRGLFRAGILRAHRLPVPVIVVGNINVGGVGKTPLTRALAEQLALRGRKPGIVSRGYGGSNVAPRAVVRGDDPGVVGDEPPLYAEAGLPVWIGHDRVEAARGLIRSHPACDVIVADDGLQHYALRRDVEVAVIDAARGLGNGWLLPAGPLREPARRLDRVDAIVLNAAATVVAPADPLRSGAAPTVPRFTMRLLPEAWRRVVDDAVVAQPSSLPREAVHAVAGIANPARFFDTLRGLGLNFVAHPFPDHHRYRAVDLAWPGARAILMTEKDAVKCRLIGDDRMLWLPVRAEIDAALVTLIEDRMHGSQAA